MNIANFIKRNLPLLALLLFVAYFGAACGSTESQNRSARPWNSPKSWEHGLPIGLTEGR